jgi:serine protease Do
MDSLKRLLFAKANNLVVILLSVALGAALATNWSRPNSLYAVDPETTTAAQKATLKTIEDGFTSIAEKVEPMVVTIEARATPQANDEENAPRAQRRRAPQPDEDEGNPFGQFPFPDLFRRFEGPDRAPARSGGSGVIVRADGNGAYVLTNWHVVRNRDRFMVTLQDKSEIPATLVGQDQKTDLAVLKLNASRPIPSRYVAALGDSNRVRVGQWAIAIGSPLSYDQTLTVGVISATGRSLGGVGGQSSYSDLIQTDAAINPGNSGGPLVNIDGEVVGINVAIASTPGAMGNIGIGFAIPINTAKNILNQLIDTGKVTRGWLGIVTNEGNRELSPALKRHFGVEGGALVDDVAPADGPAAKAGLQAGDVITRIDNEPINSFSDLERVIGSTRPNTRVTMTIVRDRRSMTIPVTLGERAPEDQLAGLLGGRRGGERPAPGQPAAEENRKLGLTVRPPTDRNVRGIEVVAVTPGGAAEDAGLATGDIIQRIGQTNVTDVASFRRATDNVRAGEELVLSVRRQTGSNQFLVLRAP